MSHIAMGNADLLKAVHKRNVRDIERALGKGADIDCMLSGEGFALGLAAKDDKNYNVTKLLLEQGANVNLRDKDGYSALDHASRNNCIKTAQLLLDHGAQIIGGEKGALTDVPTALMNAASSDSKDVMEILMEHGAKIDLQDQDGQTALIYAASGGNSRAVELLVEHHAEVNLQDSAGKTALMYTASKSRASRETMEMLIKYGAKLDLQDQNGKTALMHAVSKEAIETLINHGADVNLRNRYDKTALHVHVASDSAEAVVETLIKRGADLDMKDGNGQTALMHAAASIKKSKIIDILIKHGAKLNLQDNEGKTALMHVKLRNAFDSLMKHMHDTELLDMKDNDGKTYLMDCASKGLRKDFFEKLVKKGAEVNQQDNEGCTSLMMASENGHAEFVDLLVKKKADVNMQDNRGRTALMHSLRSSKSDVKTALIEKHGAKLDLRDKNENSVLMLACQDYPDHAELILSYCNQTHINMQNNEGMTALMIACKKGGESTIEQLLEKGAQVDVQDASGRTALMHAYSAYSEDSKFYSKVGRLLLGYSASVELRDKQGKSVLIIASENANVDDVSLFLGYKEMLNLQDDGGWSALIRACEVGSLSVAEQLIESSANTELKNKEDQTALVIACLKGFSDIVKLLIVNKAKLDLLDQDQKSLLIHASEQGHTQVVSLLLENGASVDIQDNRGWTALMHASKGGFVEIVRLLLDIEASVDMQNNQGYTALMIACEYQQAEIVALLLDKNAQILLRNNNGLTAFDIAKTNKNEHILTALSLYTNLKTDPLFPGIIFSETANNENFHVTSEGKYIDLEEVGTSLSIPKDALPSTDPPLDIQVRPCFSGPFEVPEDLELVSPVYIMKPSREVKFRKEALVKIRHHAYLETEEDCKDMVFLSASTTPEYRGTRPVYVFREIRGVKGLFRPKEKQPVGEIALKHFCKLALARIIRKLRFGGTLYSARFYKTFEKMIFCTCLFHSEYIKNCDAVIARKYGISEDSVPTEKFNSVKMAKSKIKMNKIGTIEWKTSFNKEPAMIRQEEVRCQKVNSISDLLQMDYPPRIEMSIQMFPKSADSEPLKLSVDGFDQEVTFILNPGDCLSKTDTTQMKWAIEELKQQTMNVTKDMPLVQTIEEILQIMETIDCFLQKSDQDSVKILVGKLSEMEKKCKQLQQEAEQIMDRFKRKCGMDRFVEKMNTFAVQLKKNYRANLMLSTTSKWQAALPVFVTNAANLLEAITNMMEASEQAQNIPNNHIRQDTLCILDTREVLHSLSSLTAKWRDIGIELGIHPNSIDVIEEDHQGVRNRLTQLIKLWLRQATPPPTWQDLSDAVEQISPNEAQKIRQQYSLN